MAPSVASKPFSDFIQSLPPSERYFLGSITLPSDNDAFLQDIHHNSFTLASDGSVRSTKGSFAWIIHGNTSKTQLTGRSVISPTVSALTSLCAESCGFLGSLYALRA